MPPSSLEMLQGDPKTAPLTQEQKTEIDALAEGIDGEATDQQAEAFWDKLVAASPEIGFFIPTPNGRCAGTGNVIAARNAIIAGRALLP